MTRFIKKRSEIKKPKKMSAKKKTPTKDDGNHVWVNPPLTKEYIQKFLLKKENEIVRGNKLFCSNHNIEWTKHHDICLRNAIRTFSLEGVGSIIKRMLADKP